MCEKGNKKKQIIIVFYYVYVYFSMFNYDVIYLFI